MFEESLSCFRMDLKGNMNMDVTVLIVLRNLFAGMVRHTIPLEGIHYLTLFLSTKPENTECPDVSVRNIRFYNVQLS